MQSKIKVYNLESLTSVLIWGAQGVPVPYSVWQHGMEHIAQSYRPFLSVTAHASIGSKHCGWEPCNLAASVYVPDNDAYSYYTGPLSAGFHPHNGSFRRVRLVRRVYYSAQDSHGHYLHGGWLCLHRQHWTGK